MRGAGRIVVAVLAVIGAIAVIATLGGLLLLRTAHLDLGSAAPTPTRTAPPAQEGLLADNLSADVTVSFATLEAQAGEGVRLSDAGGGRMRVNAPFQALGRSMRVETDGDLSVEGADVIVHPQALRIEGIPALDGVLSALARQAAGVRVPISDLPQGVRVTAVASTSQGVRAHVEGKGVPLPRS